MNDLALYIDIEGFSNKYNDGAKESFINLANDIHHLVKNEVFSNLAIYQFGGDGFLIKELAQQTRDLNKFIFLATILLKSILLRGGIGRVQISQGNIVDITGLYNHEIQAQINSGESNLLGAYSSYMNIIPVIGSAIINCHKLKGPSGPLLLVDRSLIPPESASSFIKYEDNSYEVFGVNWLDYKNEESHQILRILNLDDSCLMNKYNDYLVSNTLRNEWKTSAEELIRLTRAKKS